MFRLAPLCLLLGLALVPAGPAGAQNSTRAPADTTEPWFNEAWTPIVETEGVRFAYIFYSKADNVNNGVVIRLQNQNEQPVHYAFTIIFRGPNGEATARAEGRLAPGEMKTGEKDGLFWIPFKDGRTVGEVGLRGIEISVDEPSPSEAGLRLRGKERGPRPPQNCRNPCRVGGTVTVATIETLPQDNVPQP